jgi:hypothetical protein
LCIISWLAWFLVACEVSKKFIKFLRKSSKEFDLKRKMVLKISLKKKRKEKKRKTLPAPLSAQTESSSRAPGQTWGEHAN